MLISHLYGSTANCFRRADLVPGAILGICAGQHCSSFFGQIDFPAFGQDAENAERSASTEPAFRYLLEMLDTVYYIALRILLW